MASTETQKSGKILIVDDNRDLLSAARIFLKRHFLHIDTTQDPTAIPNLLRNQSFDVILLDMNFTRESDSGQEGFVWLDRILEIDPAAVVILITAYGDIEMAVRAIKEGATDFVTKPWDNERLLATLYSALRLRASKTEVSSLREREKAWSQSVDQPFREIIGNSEAMERVFRAIEQVAPTDASVLITGENGTGKELVARAIHRQSAREGGPFVGVDLGALSESLFESELFGHVKGAFTDAKTDRAGRFELADGGTLFLDEIGNLSMAMQVKLLAVLQNRQVTRVGANEPQAINIRLISATNMPLAEMIEEKQFRQDLLYRINTIEIELPPLRERKGDIDLLAGYFLERYAQRYKKPLHSISPAALKRMEMYPWPGNVRELEHAIERAVIMCQSATIQPEDLFPHGKAGVESRGEEGLQLDDYNLEEMEKVMIRKALRKHNGNVTYAAKELGLTRSSLYRRLERYGI